MDEYIKNPHKKQDEMPEQLGLFERKRTKRTNKRLTEYNYHQISSYRDIEWVGNSLPKNNKGKTLWHCKVCDCEWMGCYHDIVSSGSGCPDCAIKSRVDKQRLTVEDYRTVGIDKGIHWLENTLPESSQHDSLWGCSQGHIFEHCYHHIRHSEYGCKICGVQARADEYRLPEDDYLNIGLTRGVKWIGDTVPKTGKHKTLWECIQQGHIWETSYASIAYNSNTCPYCSGNALKTEDDYHELARQSDLIWMGDKLPKNNKEKTLWECLHEHVFERSFHGFLQTAKCPQCGNTVNGIKVSSQQSWLCDLVSGEMNVYIEGYYIDITVFLDGINIACEYDGFYWHKDKLDEDAKRDQDLIAAGWRILRVKSANKLPDKQDVISAIKLLLNGSTYEEIILDDWGKR